MIIKTGKILALFFAMLLMLLLERYLGFEKTMIIILVMIWWAIPIKK